MPGSAPRESYTRVEARRLLGVTERQLKSWERHGLVAPLEAFNFADLRVVRTLRDLRRNKVPLTAIRLVVDTMRERMGSAGDPLKELRVVSDGRRVRIEIEGQRLEPLSGQLLFNFTPVDLSRLLSFPKPRPQQDRRRSRDDADTWFQKGLQLEQSGAPIEEAIRAYETAVRLDPRSAGAWLNLGTIHFNARLWLQAEKYYRKALEADAEYPLAHFNLGNLHDDRGEWDKALEHYCAAIKLNPGYADAHYNLALLYQNRGRILEALRHWRIYLKLDPASQWAEIARREMEKLKKSTVVDGRSGPAIRVANETD